MNDTNSLTETLGLDVTRRYFLGKGAGLGLGAIALSMMRQQIKAQDHGGLIHIRRWESYPHVPSVSSF